MSIIVQSAVSTLGVMGLGGECAVAKFKKSDNESTAIFNLYSKQLQNISAVAAFTFMQVAKAGTVANPVLTGVLCCTAALLAAVIPFAELSHFENGLTKNETMNDVLAWVFKITDVAFKVFNCYAAVTFASQIGSKAFAGAAIILTSGLFIHEGYKIYQNLTAE